MAMAIRTAHQRLIYKVQNHYCTYVFVICFRSIHFCQNILILSPHDPVPINKAPDERKHQICWSAVAHFHLFKGKTTFFCSALKLPWKNKNQNNYPSRWNRQQVSCLRTKITRNGQTKNLREQQKYKWKEPAMHSMEAGWGHRVTGLFLWNKKRCFATLKGLGWTSWIELWLTCVDRSRPK